VAEKVELVMSGQRQISNQTYEFAKILTDVSNGLLRSEVLCKDPNLPGGTKDWIRRSMVNRLKVIKQDIRGLFNDDPEALAIVEKDMLDPEVAQQIQVITDMLLALPKGIRDEIETYVGSRHHVYAQKNNDGIIY
jgi:hypothetical protein